MPVITNWTSHNQHESNPKVRKVRDAVTPERIVYLLPIGGGFTAELHIAEGNIPPGLDARIEDLSAWCVEQAPDTKAVRHLTLVNE